ncbi:UbiD decarboxylyase family [Moorella glycerini]|uniref:3-octaprenyl-4-hydroxybenzoate carboxy-lyase n=1 Tax=Neomoorella stamsii TaxID=1266720 RepID=A0A9X7J0U3_9FIRM|nr:MULTISPECIES: UbiD family decarboxylase [Moorella]PRR68671.1 3-octaprenyl-4-hydroxybenzoate carboxy-lyase [Moorella stamsii]CEP68990.1 UbiD decarboxylyase family [Moorella glycerini]
MPYKDLREYLKALEEHHDLLRVKKPIDTYLEVGKVLRKLYSQEGPAVIFENPIGSDVPLVGAVYSTRSKALLAFESDEEHIMDKVLAGMKRPLAPVLKDKGECQENVILDNIDLSRFPIPFYTPKDGGRYLTAAITVSKDPETGVPDIGIYRWQVIGPDRLSFLAQPFHRFGKNLAKAKKLGLPFEAALVIGTDPVLAYTTQFKVPDNTNDWFLAGGLRGEPVELVKCKTVDLEVPATAEVVLELKINYEEEVMEGPFGEYTGYYTPASLKPTARVTAITHRDNPLFLGLLTGKPVNEVHILKQIPFEASFYDFLKPQFPSVKKVAIPPCGGVSFYVVIAIQQRYAGEARQVIMAALSHTIRPKWVVVVDDDINVQDLNDVNWALSFHVRPKDDIFIIDNVPAGPLDPVVRESAQLTKRLLSAVGIDATRPFGEGFPALVEVPGWEDYDLNQLNK